jgi:hypothetical protein
LTGLIWLKRAAFLGQGGHLAEVVLSEDIGCITNVFVPQLQLGMREKTKNLTGNQEGDEIRKKAF